MATTFYIAGAVAVLGSLMAITRPNVVHALLYLVVSFFGIAVIFYALGAPFIAALEVIVYAGAIVVLFLFVVILLNPGPRDVETERSQLTVVAWAGPVLLAAILLVETLLLIRGARGDVSGPVGPRVVESREVGRSLFGPYLLAVELAGLLLLAALVAAFHVGRPGREQDAPPRKEES